MNSERKNKNIKKVIYFFGVMIGVFGLTYFSLYIAGFVPNNLRVENIITDEDLPKNKEVFYEGTTIPDRIIIKKIGIDTKVLKPNAINVSILDEFLKQGAVYYPGSGTVEKGNIFVFGHSTNWPVVQNPAYKTFNGLDKLKNGDEIIIEAENKEFFYKVKSVELVNADDAIVEFDNSGQTLTLSTCNTFGEKQERWVVVAERKLK
jgi:LPXTG-site transpeptidase (sortase) family protein